MGLNIIGFLIIAPKTITENQKNAALERVIALTARAAALEEDKERFEISQDSMPSAWFDTRAALLRDLGWSAADVTDSVDEGILDQQEQALEQLCMIETDSFLADLTEFISGNPRDTAQREHPDNSEEVLLFCGAATWGDEPDGLGYGVMKTITLCRLETILGIR